MKRFIAIALLATALTGCESMGDREGLGAVFGSVAGGLLGAQVGSGDGKAAAAALGALGGWLFGRDVGRKLDDVDRLKVQHSTAKALESQPSGTSSGWNNPDSGNSGQTTPTRTFQRDDGSYCREFTQTINVGGQTEEAYGTACRQPDGTWKIVS